MTKLDKPKRDALDLLLDELQTALEQENFDQARALLARAVEHAGPDHPDVAYVAASVIWHEHGPVAAAASFARVVELEPEHADAHYALAAIAEERGLTELAIEHNLKVLRLDARQARNARLGSAVELDFIDEVATRVLRELPAPFSTRLRNVPVVLEARPSLELVKAGLDPRALGLFDGPTDADSDSGIAAPTRIVLYTHNLLADFPEEDDLIREIEVTMLHEIGHFFGLDEDDMQRLGLD